MKKPKLKSNYQIGLVTPCKSDNPTADSCWDVITDKWGGVFCCERQEDAMIISMLVKICAKLKIKV